MQRFILTITDNHEGPITAEWLQSMLEDMDMEVMVIEIPQPPFTTGMDTNQPYQINIPGEPMPKTIYPEATIPPDYAPFTVRCGVQIWGTPQDIDSGIRHHIDICEECQQLERNDTP